MIPRTIGKKIQERLFKGKVIIIMGARQTGKTTLLRSLMLPSEDTLWLNGDEPDVQAVFENASSDRLKAFLGNHRVVVIDEAQRISNIGVGIKLIKDHYPNVQVVATGSSSFELANKVNEPLTGRKWEFQLHPLSFQEMVQYHGLIKEKRLLEHRLVYGYYPEVVTSEGDEKAILKELSDSYLYKDILLWEGIKKPEKLVKLLQALAFQVGNQVSNNELSRLTGLDGKTVESYIYLLEQTYVVFRLSSFSRNLRNELKASKKIYFYDNGIRNAIIANFQPVGLRADTGALWENFLMAERLKRNHYHDHFVNSYFWRTKEQQEIDYIEEENGQLLAAEFKWRAETKAKIPATFLKHYPESQQSIVTPENFESFVMGEWEE
ncbi:ATP-binding protein [Chitinophagaceae bacterium LB-8]|uniref:ATP-binding protein n=1 Tax=Paraflavisolibacter caeni TaxID=2982496 RepID=A0A9X2XXN6_9BACT|nr:ATP-binding protein [Paraflavisolibacter caeni]MCU7551276.1 ATP-binding protein [Paraflavisolibacter caeni]